MLANHYAENYDETTLREVISEDDVRVARFMPPKGHAPINAKERDATNAGPDDMWRDFTDIMLNPPIGLSEFNRIDTPERTLDDLLSIEIRYQNKGRPSQTADRDPYESIFREYVMGDKLVGSDELMAVRDDLRQALHNPNPAYPRADDIYDRYQQLVSLWEAHHPGIMFDDLSPSVIRF